MTSGWYVVVLGVLVIIGILLGFGLALWIADVTGGAAFAFGRGAGMLVVTFGSCTLGVVVMYLLCARIENRIRGRARAERAAKKRSRKRRRKKK